MRKSYNLTFIEVVLETGIGVDFRVLSLFDNDLDRAGFGLAERRRLHRRRNARQV